MNEHSKKFETVKKYYESGVWNKTMVRNSVTKGWIAIAEYIEITGEDYTEPNGAE